MGSGGGGDPARALCLFTCGSRRHALGLDSVVGVIEPGRLVRIPASPPEILGLCVHRGGIVPVAWPGGGDGETPADPGPSTVVLLLRSEHGPWGLAIDRGGVVIVEERPRSPAGPPSCADFLRIVGEVDRAEGRYELLDPARTWHALRSAIEGWYSGAIGNEVAPSPPSSRASAEIPTSPIHRVQL